MKDNDNQLKQGHFMISSIGKIWSKGFWVSSR